MGENARKEEIGRDGRENRSTDGTDGHRWNPSSDSGVAFPPEAYLCPSVSSVDQSCPFPESHLRHLRTKLFVRHLRTILILHPFPIPQPVSASSHTSRC